MFANGLALRLSVLTLMVTASPSASGRSLVANADAESGSRPDPASFAIYALSRGSGVPAQTRAVFEDIERQLLELQRQRPDMRVERQIIGLEGEIRLCISIDNREVAEHTYRHIRQLGRDIDLLNISLEPCGGLE